jgi:hypothetical protein
MLLDMHSCPAGGGIGQLNLASTVSIRTEPVVRA